MGGWWWCSWSLFWGNKTKTVWKNFEDRWITTKTKEKKRRGKKLKNKNFQETGFLCSLKQKTKE